MVNIRRAKQSFQLRDRHHPSRVDREKMGLFVAGITVVALVLILWGSLRNVPDDTTIESLRRNSRQKDPNHPHLQNDQAQPLGEKYNAIALDVMKTLNCEQLFNDTLTQLHRWDEDYKSMRDRNGLQDDIGMIENEEISRRLGQVDQHGDDGGLPPDLDGGKGFDDGLEADPADDTPQEEEKWGREAAGGEFPDFQEMDDGMGGMGDFSGDMDYDGIGAYAEVTGAHLFCLAAMESSPEEIRKEIACPASMSKRKVLLNLWTSARSQITDPKLLMKVLSLAQEQKGQQILGHDFNLWSPKGDEGISYMVNTLNSDNDVDNGGIHGLQDSLGPGKLFVDVGSCLGTTTLAISSEYPGTKIVSIEAASPNWLLQEMNLRCNLDTPAFRQIKLILSGVGSNSDDEDSMMAKLMWRPTATTSTRSWTPVSEVQSDDVELIVRLRKLRSILAEADVFDTSIDVMNIDCEGCEYNVIPALTDAEFEAIPTVMGGVHWGYIPITKLPSSKRGRTTHERLCTHENIARTTKECCAYPTLTVKSSVPGEVLVRDGPAFPPTASTVSDVIPPDLCVDFDQWAIEHSYNDINDDWKWSELTSEAI